MSRNGKLDEGMTSEVYKATRIYDKAECVAKFLKLSNIDMNGE
jgi:hypothetical protein